MNEIYNRLKGLFDALGLLTEEGSYAEAEAWALASGISLVKNALDRETGYIFFSNSEETDRAKRFAKMLGIDYTKAAGDILEGAVKARLSHNYGEAAVSEAYNAERQLLGDIAVNENSSGYLIEGINSDNIYFLGAFTDGAVPFDKPAYTEGEGLTFSKYDSLRKTWNFYNTLSLPFACYDTLEEGVF